MKIHPAQAATAPIPSYLQMLGRFFRGPFYFLVLLAVPCLWSGIWREFTKVAHYSGWIAFFEPLERLVYRL